MAQRREMRDIESALAKGQLAEAYTTYESINENEVEPKYAAQYNLYKSAYILDLRNPQKNLTLEELRNAEAALKKAKELDLEQDQISSMVENYLINKKLGVANTLAQSGEVEKARDLVDELYQMDTENYGMLYNSANLSYAAEDFARAMQDYDKLVNVGYTGSETIFIATSKANNQAENFPNETTRDMAVRTGSHTNPQVETTPSNVGDIASKLVWLYKNDKGLKSAETTYDRIMAKYPNDASLKVAKPNILLTLEKMDEYEKATEKLKQTVKDPAVYENLAMAAYNNKDYDKAIENFESAIALAPSYALHVNLSNAYIEKGNLEKTSADQQLDLYRQAVQNLEKAHEMKTDDKGIIATLASLYEFLEMPDKAEALKAKM
jgi:tetratricopeptide (TPR) repeat protein